MSADDRSQWTLADDSTARVNDLVLVGHNRWIGKIVGSTVNDVPIVRLDTGPATGWRMELHPLKLCKASAHRVSSAG